MGALSFLFLCFLIFICFCSTFLKSCFFDFYVLFEVFSAPLIWLATPSAYHAELSVVGLPNESDFDLSVFLSCSLRSAISSA